MKSFIKNSIDRHKQSIIAILTLYKGITTSDLVKRLGLSKGTLSVESTNANKAIKSLFDQNRIKVELRGKSKHFYLTEDAPAGRNYLESPFFKNKEQSHQRTSDNLRTSSSPSHYQYTMEAFMEYMNGMFEHYVKDKTNSLQEALATLDKAHGEAAYWQEEAKRLKS